MSHKKRKKKLNKKLIEQRLRELETEAKENKGEKTIKPQNQVIAKKQEVSVETPTKTLDPSDQLIIKDLKKLALVAAVIILIFAGLIIVNLKTNYILIASDKILNILHVGQL